jgi:Zn-dependent protease
MEPFTIAIIIALIISVIMHEMAHGYAANWLGDPTARLQGRLTPNPLVHIDPLMSVIVPGLLVLTGSPILFGAAKPVPYNPYNFTNQKWGEAIVAGAGPATNIVLAIIFGLLVRSADVLQLSDTFVALASVIVLMNIFLALLNLIPIPPLDGSKILPRLLPFSLAMRYEELRQYMERNTIMSFAIIIFAFVFIFSKPLFLSSYFITTILTGNTPVLW